MRILAGKAASEFGIASYNAVMFPYVKHNEANVLCWLVPIAKGKRYCLEVQKAIGKILNIFPKSTCVFEFPTFVQLSSVRY